MQLGLARMNTHEREDPIKAGAALNRRTTSPELGYRWTKPCTATDTNRLDRMTLLGSIKYHVLEYPRQKLLPKTGNFGVGYKRPRFEVLL